MDRTHRLVSGRLGVAVACNARRRRCRRSRRNRCLRASAQLHVGFVSVAGAVPLREPTTQVPGSATPTTGKTDTAHLPTAPEPGAAAPGNGRTVWPASQTGWTIVLVSYPKTFGHPQALATATQAAKKGLNQVGVVDSSLYASLQPGYYVVFAGIYASRADSDAAVGTARQAGFPGAYSREIAR